MGIQWSKKSNPYMKVSHRSAPIPDVESNFSSLNLELFTLVWLDRAAETTADNVELLAQLRKKVNCVRVFTHLETCRMFIEAHSIDTPLVIVVSGSFGSQLVPQVHHLDQVNSIYIFCMKRAHYAAWASPYTKILAVTDDANELLTAIGEDYRRRRHLEDSLIQMTIYNSKEQKSHTNVTTENGNFMYFQLLIEVFLRMTHTITSKKDLLDKSRYIYADKADQLKCITEFERTYSPNKAIWWYTRESCFYKMLNKALREQDIDLLFAFRFFITDLRKQLADLHARPETSSIFRVYRAQLVHSNELNRLHTSIGEFISLNSFISTSMDRRRATKFLAQHDPTSDQLQHILFEIDIDPSLETKPYANITAHSRYPEECEVLFMLGCIFRIRKIWREDSLWLVQLALCAENDHHFVVLFADLKRKLSDKTDLCSFGNVLFEMAEYDKAHSYYQRLLNELPETDKKTRAACYHGLGVIAKRRDEIDLALCYHEESLKLNRAVPNNDLAIAASLHSLANEYKEKGKYEKALDYYTKARNIKFNLAGRETPDTASTYYHIARLYEKQRNYDEALTYHNKALEIQCECLPPDHHSIGKTYGCMGSVYFNLGNDVQALHFFEQSLEIKRKSLPSTHQFIGITLDDLGSVYERMNQFPLALSHFEQALEIYRLTLSSTDKTHKRIEKIEASIRSVKEKITELNST